jgi:hypothetical protein
VEVVEKHLVRFAQDDDFVEEVENLLSGTMRQWSASRTVVLTGLEL